MAVDPIVTLLDGTKIPKSKVPRDTIYINEKGIKVKKVVVQVPVKTFPKPVVPEKKGFFDSISDVASSVANTAAKTAGTVANTAAKTAGTVANAAVGAATTAVSKVSDVASTTVKTVGEMKDVLSVMASKKISEWISKVPFDKTIKDLEDFQKENGVDVSNLIDLLKKLKGIK